MPKQLASVILLCVSSIAWGISTADPIDLLIDQLAHPDPLVRQEASEKLLRLGEAAREKLTQAGRSPRPAVASAASSLLARLPWTLPGDSEIVVGVLQNYGVARSSERIERLHHLLNQADTVPDAVSACLRVLNTETSSEVAWQVALSGPVSDSPSWRQAIHNIDPVRSSGPVTLIAGRFSLLTRQPQARQWLQQAMNQAKEQSGDMNAWMIIQFYNLAAQAQLHAQAAEWLEQFQNLARNEGLILQQNNVPEQAQEVQIHHRILWHRFKDADSRQDEPARKKIAQQILESSSDEMEIFLDVLPVLEKTVDQAKVDDYFQKVYDRQKSNLDAKPDEPVHSNDLAWLLARSGRQLQQALILAQRAVEAEPDNPAFLDTLAEVHFRLGQIDQAIALEEKALKILPNDPFMTEQIRRFRNAQKPDN